MSKRPGSTTVGIQRLLEERRQYESWIARIDAAGGATPNSVRSRVRGDYEARLRAVIDELKVHADAARQMVAQRREFRGELQKKESAAAERLSEAELRHAVGEYDEAQWTQVHKDCLAELVSVREELQSVEEDVAQLEELERLVRAKPATPPPPPPTPAPSPAPTTATTPARPMPKVGSPPRPPAPEERKAPAATSKVDELAFLKSVTEDEKGLSGAAPPRRASGAQFQPVEAARPAPAAPPAASPMSRPSDTEEAVRTLKCKECGTMNLPTEWYCENCGAELAAL
ncbi:MAG TPA: hypothetical protein VMH88_02140 [Gemmatimonadales bacterium]|nr:hypothetical protein [Gemmatimonadales bacterium]